MTGKTVFSIIESPLHPDFSTLYAKHDFQQHAFRSVRQALQSLKKQAPELVVADFIYGYGNNYAGVNISNLDVMLYSMQKYSPEARLVVMVEKHERQYVDKLNEIFTLTEVFVYPVSGSQIEQLL